MKRIMNSMVIAFAMYSKIPMPRVDWEKENMQYAMCFFPFVGAVIAAAVTGFRYLAAALGFGAGLESAGIALLPILITGGIHLDGYLDTVDALSSYQPKEKKLEILKDPHTGAFAIIYGIAYGIALYGLCSEVLKVPVAGRAWWTLMLGYMLSRAISGCSVVCLTPAKKSGLLAMFQSAADKKKAGIVMAAWIICCAIGMVCICPLAGAVLLFIAAGVFFLYRAVAYRQFGGVTGDLAGFFLVLCELGMLAGVILLARWC